MLAACEELAETATDPAALRRALKGCVETIRQRDKQIAELKAEMSEERREASRAVAEAATEARLEAGGWDRGTW